MKSKCHVLVLFLILTFVGSSDGARKKPKKIKKKDMPTVEDIRMFETFEVLLEMVETSTSNEELDFLIAEIESLIITLEALVGDFGEWLVKLEAWRAANPDDPPPPPPDPDSDGDGVPDSIDQCPDTAPGIVVDEFGCPIIVDPPDPPPGLDLHTHTPIPYDMPPATSFMLCNPDNFNAQYKVFATSPAGTHLVLENGTYVRPSTNQVVVGSLEFPMVIRAENPGQVLIESDAPNAHTLMRLEAGSSHVQYRDLNFGKAFFHVLVTSKIEGTSHHVMFADCDFTECWGSSTLMKGHDFTWRHNKWHNTALHNIDGSKASGWYWTAGAENYVDTNGNWVNPANLSFFDNEVDTCGGEGLILSRCTSGVAKRNTVFNALTVGIYWQNGIFLTIANNHIGANKHRFLQNFPNARPAGTAGAVEAWDDKVPTRAQQHVIIRDNLIDAGQEMMNNPIAWWSRGRDNNPEHNTYGGIIVLNNTVIGTPRRADVEIDQLDDLDAAPGPQNVIRHDGPIILGDPSYWDVLTP